MLQGHRIETLAPDAIVKRGISQIPEGRRVFSGLTVRENLEVGAATRLKWWKLTRLASRAERPDGAPGADRGYVLETGRIVLEGSGKDFLHNAAVTDAYLGGRHT